MDFVVVSGVKAANGFAEEKKAEELKTEAELDDEDFEFSFDCCDFPASPVSADVVFCDWKMKQSFPLIVSCSADEIEEVATLEEERRDEDAVHADADVGSSRREVMTLGQLTEVEKAAAVSSSSPSDAGEIEPPAAAEDGGNIKRTGSFKRWWLRNVLWKGEIVHEESGGGESAGEGGRRKEAKRPFLLSFNRVGLLRI